MRESLRRWLPEPALRVLRTGRRLWWRLGSRVWRPPVDEPVRPAVGDAAVRLLVGPANFAGQAWAWGRTVERELDGVSATVMAVERGRLVFASDYGVPESVYRSHRWALAQRRWIEGSFTHVLIDSMRPLMGPLYGDDCGREIPVLRRAGLTVGLIAHGSDIRVPSRHRELYPYSPFDPGLDETRRLQAQSTRLSAVMLGFDGPTFVSTPDLLDFAPSAQWLPTVVDPADWASDVAVLERRRPVVLHVPSSPFLKGSALVDPALQELHERGLIDYRRLEGVDPRQMPGLVGEADVVLDQFVLGLYSVMAIQGMAAGRLVVAHVHPRVRARLPRELPVVESGPAAVTAVLERILSDREGFRALAAEGPAYASAVHDGRVSARVLSGFLGRPLRRPEAPAAGPVE